MALERYDRIQDTTTTTGTGTITLTGTPVVGFRAFSGNVTDGATVRYFIESADLTEWEVGQGVYTASGTTLSRVTIYSSSNSGSAVNFSAGTKNVGLTLTRQDTREFNTWTQYSAVTPTTGTFDAPSYPIVLAGVDLTGVLQPGMRVKITQSTDKFFLITKVAFSTDTTVTLYGGTDYSLVASGTTAISAFYYSSHKAPYGFPINSTKWTQVVTDTSLRTQGSPVSGTWYNTGTISIVIPIGDWNVKYSAEVGVDRAALGTVTAQATLSTANNTESDADFTFEINGASTALFNSGYREKIISLSSKTTYYANHRTNTSSMSNIYFANSLTKMNIRAVSAYL